MTRFRSYLPHFAQGLLMGGADAIPGVSGGTMALVVGIYGRLLASIGHVFHGVVSAIRFDIKTARARFRQVEWGLIVPLGIGILTALVVAAGTVPDLLERYPAQSRGLFLGLVAASIAIPWRRIGGRDSRSWLIAVAFAVPAFVITGLPNATISRPALWQVFLGAAVAICAMILPGVSGAFLLLVVGLYEPTLRALDERNLVYVLVFVTGAAVGLGSFATVLNRLLLTHHDVTMAALVGLMAGSLRALWPWQTDTRGLLSPAEGPVLWVLILAVVGFVFVSGIERLSRNQTEVA